MKKNKTYSAVFQKKLEGYALPLAIFISIVVIILSSILILAAYYNNYFFNRIAFADKLNSNAVSAINLLLIHPDQLDYSDIKYISLYGEYGDSVKLEKEQWGIFDLFTVTAFNKNQQAKRSVITGSYKYDPAHTALFVPDQGKPISVTGNVNIAGNCLLPESGFKQAHIEGKSFTGKAINGEIKKSPSALPPLNENIARLNMEYFRDKYLSGTSKIILFEELSGDTLITSFQDTATLLYSSHPIELNHLFLQGKIIVLSEQTIHIAGNTGIDGIICVAPYISISENFTGKLQLFAEDSILIQDNCYLKYPSTAGISASGRGNKPPVLRIGNNTLLSGVAFIYEQTTELNKQPLLQAGTQSVIKGQVYSSGYAEIKGSIYGSLYTSKFILATPSAVYENTLMDMNIDMHKLSSHYVGADLLNEKSPGGVIKWVQ